MDIHVDWEGPFTFEQAKELNSDQDFGLYQFYGEHPVYGAAVLLYIGKAVKQTFGSRLKQHNWQSWVPTPVELYIGRICTESEISNNEWESLIDLAEKIQIFSHSPAFNTSNLNQINATNSDARIMNWGMRKSLLPEISIERWEGSNTLGHDMLKKLSRCGL